MVVARLHQQPVNVVMAEDRRDARGRLALAIDNGGVGPGGEQPADLARVAAHHGRMQQRIAEGTLCVGIAERMGHALDAAFIA